MSHDVKTLAAIYYCYFVADHYLNKASTLTFSAYIMIDMLPLIEDYIAESDFSDGSEAPAWYAFAKEFMQTPEYEQLKSVLPMVASGAEIATDKINFVKDTIKGFAVNMTAKVLGSGVSALTIDEQEKADLLVTMTSDEVARPLTEFFVYLLLGSDEDTIAPFDPSNKNVALAVTFLANAGRYMRVHNNEIILSWLRTEDSYYANEDWHIHSMGAVFDANGHWSECECGHKEEISAHAFGEWSTDPVNNGEKDVLVRRCPCGYEETKDAPAVGDTPAPTVKPLGAGAIVLICVGSVIILSGITVMVVITKKKKTAKK